MIRYMSTKQEKDLIAEMRKYNRRITQLKRQKRFQGVILPQKLNIKNEISRIYKYYDYKRITNLIQRTIFEPGALNVVKTGQGFKITAGLKKQISLDVAAANRRRKQNQERFAKRDIIVDKKRIGKAEEIHKERFVPKIRGIDKIKSKKYIEEKIKSLRVQGTDSYWLWRTELFRTNFTDAIRRELGGYVDTTELITKIKGINLELFREMYYLEPVIDMTFIYNLEKAVEKYEELRTTINKYLSQNEQIGDPLKSREESQNSKKGQSKNGKKRGK